MSPGHSHICIWDFLFISSNFEKPEVIGILHRLIELLPPQDYALIYFIAYQDGINLPSPSFFPVETYYQPVCWSKSFCGSSWLLSTPLGISLTRAKEQGGVKNPFV